MSLKKEYVRDGKRRVIGSVTNGFSDESSVVRDEENQIAGRTSERFHTTRDAGGGLVSIGFDEQRRSRLADQSEKVVTNLPPLPGDGVHQL
jgi:hypothetical protein